MNKNKLPMRSGVGVVVLNNENKFSYSFRTTEKKKQITNILIEEPKPFINNYKFIKGFEKGRLNLNSQKIGNISNI